MNNNQSYYSAAFAPAVEREFLDRRPVGCFFGPCGDKLRQAPQALTADGVVPTLAVVEWNRLTFTPEGYLYVAQWNGSAWKALGSKLNAHGSGTQVLEAAVASDGSNPTTCWSEQVVASDRRTVSTLPQIHCAQWTGSSWVPLGSVLNRSASSWASDPTMTFAGGKFYTGWVERAVGGPSKLYVCRWDG